MRKEIDFNKPLSRFANNKNGSVLTLVIGVSAVTFIIVMALLSLVNNTTQVNANVNSSDRAYLAARSGITLISKEGSNKDFAKKLYESCLPAGTAASDSNAIFFKYDDPDDSVAGDVTLCKVWAFDEGNISTGTGALEKKVKVICTGVSDDGQEFTLTRFFKFKQSGVVNTNEMKTTAYTHYGDGDIKIVGGIDGDVIIIGNGHIDSSQANLNNRMHKVVCTNSLNLNNSGSVYKLLATGKHLIFDSGHIDTEVYVGSTKYDSVSYKFTDVLEDNIFCSIRNTNVGSAIRCEGETIVGNTIIVNVNNAEFASGVTGPTGGMGNYGLNDVIGVKKSEDAIISRGDVYIGYFTDSESFTVGDSVPQDGGGNKICGNVISGGDVHLYGTSTVYGDIICKGNLYLEDNGIQITGNIYVGGDFIIEGISSSMDYNLPNLSTKVIEVGGTFTNKVGSSWTAEQKEALSKKVSAGLGGLVNKTDKFTGDYVGAADYFKDNYEGSPKPTTNFPSKFSGAATGIRRVHAGDTVKTTTSETTYCPNYCDKKNDPNCWEDEYKTCTNEWCGMGSHYVTDPSNEICQWYCPVGTANNEQDKYPQIWKKESWGGYSHIPHLKMTHVETTYATGNKLHINNHPVINNKVIDSKTIHITNDAILEGTIDLGGGQFGADGGYAMYTDKIYIDCSPQTSAPDAKGNNIDIMLAENCVLNLNGDSSIIVNDYGGKWQVRFFMSKGSRINFNGGDCLHTGILVVSDTKKDLKLTDIPLNLQETPMKAIDWIDKNKIPQLYIFGQNGINDIELNVGGYGYFPGYVLMPDVDIKAKPSSHNFKDGSFVGYDQAATKADVEAGTATKSDSNYPSFYGMLMCNSLDFDGSNTTFVKYDYGLDNVEDPANPGKMVKSARRTLFDSALTRDGVMLLTGGGGATPSPSPTPGELSWEITECF